MNWSSSTFVWPELIVSGVVLFLLDRLPRHSIAGRIVAALSGCVVIAIIVALWVVDLHKDTVFGLAILGMGLALGLLDWPSRSKVSRERPQSTQ